MHAVAGFLRKFIDTVTLSKKSSESKHAKKKKGSRSLDSGLGLGDEDVDDVDVDSHTVSRSWNNDIADRQRGEHLKIPAHRLKCLLDEGTECTTGNPDDIQESPVSRSVCSHSDSEGVFILVPTCRKVKVLSFIASPDDPLVSRSGGFSDGFRNLDSHDGDGEAQEFQDAPQSIIDGKAAPDEAVLELKDNPSSLTEGEIARNDEAKKIELTPQLVTDREAAANVVSHAGSEISASRVPQLPEEEFTVDPGSPQLPLVDQYIFVTPPSSPVDSALIEPWTISDSNTHQTDQLDHDTYEFIHVTDHHTVESGELSSATKHDHVSRKPDLQEATDEFIFLPTMQMGLVTLEIIADSSINSPVTDQTNAEEEIALSDYDGEDLPSSLLQETETVSDAVNDIPLQRNGICDSSDQNNCNQISFRTEATIVDPPVAPNIIPFTKTPATFLQPKTNNNLVNYLSTQSSSSLINDVHSMCNIEQEDVNVKLIEDEIENKHCHNIVTKRHEQNTTDCKHSININDSLSLQTLRPNGHKANNYEIQIETKLHMKTTHKEHCDVVCYQSNSLEQSTAAGITNSLEQNTFADTTSLLEQNTFADTTSLLEKNTAADTTSLLEKNTAADTTSLLEKNTAADTTSLLEKNTAADTTSLLEKNTAADTTSLLEKNTAADTTSLLEKNTAADTTSLLEKNTAADTTSLLEKNTAADTTSSLEKNTAADATSLLEKNTAADTTSLLEKNTAADITSLLEQNTAADTTSLLEQNSVAKTTSSLEQNTAVETTSSLEQNTAADTTSSLEQNTAADITSLLEQNTAADTTSSLEGNTASDAISTLPQSHKNCVQPEFTDTSYESVAASDRIESQIFHSSSHDGIAFSDSEETQNNYGSNNGKCPTTFAPNRNESHTFVVSVSDEVRESHKLVASNIGESLISASPSFDSQLTVGSVEDSLTESVERSESLSVEHFYILVMPSILDSDCDEQPESIRTSEISGATAKYDDSACLTDKRLPEETLQNMLPPPKETIEPTGPGLDKCSEKEAQQKLDKTNDSSTVVTDYMVGTENRFSYPPQSACVPLTTRGSQRASNGLVDGEASDDEDDVGITCLVDSEHEDGGALDSDSDSSCSDCSCSSSNSNEDSSDEEFINIIRNSRFKILPVIYEAEDESNHMTDQEEGVNEEEEEEEEEFGEEEARFYNTLEVGTMGKNSRAHRFKEYLISTTRCSDHEPDRGEDSFSRQPVSGTVTKSLAAGETSITDIRPVVATVDQSCSKLNLVEQTYLRRKERSEYQIVLWLLSKVWMPRDYYRHYPLVSLRVILACRFASLGLRPGANLTPEAGHFLLVSAFSSLISRLDKNFFIESYETQASSPTHLDRDRVPVCRAYFK
ncbi:hypothetical protein RRG08_053063 [Elysia crispata]|uniref:Uncharacterized protein n=1 Tax=Elysia crispata TaxID=231223 RepID=A0AAE1CLB6_9GAST|nr:hypothetical protein RRG08_053063 [Elysia crispata]